MCNSLSTTKEHVPPKAFFPKGYRKNLWRVESCSAHNNDNSLDVEYASACIVNAMESTGDALEENQRKVLRAYERKPGFFWGSINDFRPLRLTDGDMTATFRVDLQRFNSVMNAIAFGVYRYFEGKNYERGWTIFNPDLHSFDSTYRGRRDRRESIISALDAMSFIENRVPEPDVFQCGVHRFDDGSVVYKFNFYNGFTVYAVDRFIYEIMTYGRL